MEGQIEPDPGEDRGNLEERLHEADGAVGVRTRPTAYDDLGELLDPAEVAAAKALATRMADRALRLGGTITGEHGIGAGKRGLMAAEHGAGWQAMGRIKTALDPRGILNPGKVLD